MLTGTANVFQELAVGREGLAANAELFRNTLGPSLEDWRAAGSKAAWLEVPLTRAGEHVVEATVREVFEETAIHTRFESLVCFRH